MLQRGPMERAAFATDDEPNSEDILSMHRRAHRFVEDMPHTAGMLQSLLAPKMLICSWTAQKNPLTRLLHEHTSVRISPQRHGVMGDRHGAIPFCTSRVTLTKVGPLPCCAVGMLSPRMRLRWGSLHTSLGQGILQENGISYSQKNPEKMRAETDEPTYKTAHMSPHATSPVVLTFIYQTTALLSRHSL